MAVTHKHEVGVRYEKYRAEAEMIRRIVEAANTIGNHTKRGKASYVVLPPNVAELYKGMQWQ